MMAEENVAADFLRSRGPVFRSTQDSRQVRFSLA